MRERFKYVFTIEPTSNPILLADSERMTGDDISLIRDEEDDKDTQIQFSSIHLNELEDPADIWDRGESLRRIYLGVKAIVNGYFDHPNQPRYFFKLVNLYNSKDDSRITPNNIEIKVPMFPYSSIKLKEPTDTASRIIYLSKKNKDVLALLIQFGSGPGWINLYGILDTLKYYSKSNKFDIIKLCDLENEIDAFTGIANNFGLIGIEARHGERGYGIPQKDISLREATLAIIKLTRAYLNKVHQFNFQLEVDDKQEEDPWTFIDYDF